MFLVTSITMLRERTSGTLERLMTMPLGKIDLLFGYALAFAAVAIVQAAVVVQRGDRRSRRCTSQGSVLVVAGIAVLNALLGMSLGLFVSAFATTEFQAVQFMPAFVFPQLILCGLFARARQHGDAARVALGRPADDVRLRRPRPHRAQRNDHARRWSRTSRSSSALRARARTRRGDAQAPHAVTNRHGPIAGAVPITGHSVFGHACPVHPFTRPTRKLALRLLVMGAQQRPPPGCSHLRLPADRRRRGSRALALPAVVTTSR